MMAHADYFVGSSTSGIPHVVATLRMTVYLKSQVFVCLLSPSHATAFCNPLCPSCSAYLRIESLQSLVFLICT